MKKKTKKYIHQTLLNEIEMSELDLELQDFVFGANPDGHDCEDTILSRSKKGNYWWYGQNSYLEIDKAIKTLQKLKREGATHVDITPHSDHFSYYFYGSIFRQATEEEIQKELTARENAEKLVAKVEMEKAIKLIEDNPELAKQLRYEKK